MSASSSRSHLQLSCPVESKRRSNAVSALYAEARPQAMNRSVRLPGHTTRAVCFSFSSLFFRTFLPRGSFDVMPRTLLKRFTFFTFSVSGWMLDLIFFTPAFARTFVFRTVAGSEPAGTGRSFLRPFAGWPGDAALTFVPLDKDLVRFGRATLASEWRARRRPSLSWAACFPPVFRSPLLWPLPPLPFPFPYFSSNFCRLFQLWAALLPIAVRPSARFVGSLLSGTC